MANREETETTRAETAKLKREDILNAGGVSPLGPPEIQPLPRPTAGEYSVLQRKPRGTGDAHRGASAMLSAHTTPDGHVSLSINGHVTVLTANDARALASLIVNLITP